MINTKKFLNTLKVVKPGLDSKALIEQADCFVFKGGGNYNF